LSTPIVVVNAQVEYKETPVDERIEAHDSVEMQETNLSNESPEFEKEINEAETYSIEKIKNASFRSKKSYSSFRTGSGSERNGNNMENVDGQASKKLSKRFSDASKSLESDKSKTADPADEPETPEMTSETPKQNSPLDELFLDVGSSSETRLNESAEETNGISADHRTVDEDCCYSRYSGKKLFRARSTNHLDRS